MITVTLGTIPYQFDRAIAWLDMLLESGVVYEPIFIQHGVTDISAIATHPLVKAVPLVESKTLFEMVKSSRLVISHAGQGSTRALAHQKTSFTLLPRLARYHEHIDDHQLLFAENVKKFGVSFCLTLDDLKQVIQQPPPAFQSLLFGDPKLCDHLSAIYPSSTAIR